MKKHKRGGIQLNKIKGTGYVFGIFVAVLAVCVLSAAVWASYQVACCLRPVPVMAKESFAGIGETVEGHDEDNPYKILDIVPSSVFYDVQITDDTGNTTGVERRCFSTGTLGYLADGQTPLTQDFAVAFQNLAFRCRVNRETLFHKIVSRDAVDNFPWIQYEEAYGGIHDVSGEAEGWEMVFDSQYIEDAENIDATAMAGMPEGMFQGTYEKIRPGEDAGGYDYVALEGLSSGGTGAEVYEHNADGAWHLVFSAVEQPEEGMELYEAQSVHAYDIGSYSYATGLYCLDGEGKYEYAGTVAQVIYGKDADYFGTPDNNDNEGGDKDPEDGSAEGGSEDGSTDTGDSSGTLDGDTGGDGDATQDGNDDTDRDGDAGTGDGGDDAQGGDTDADKDETQDDNTGGDGDGVQDGSDGAQDDDTDGDGDAGTGDGEDGAQDGDTDTDDDGSGDTGIGDGGSGADGDGSTDTGHRGDNAGADGDSGAGTDRDNGAGADGWRELVAQDVSGNADAPENDGTDAAMPDTPDSDEAVDGDNEEEWVPVGNLDREYYVVVFGRAEDVSAASGILYQIERREPVKGQMRPFDAYDMASRETTEEPEGIDRLSFMDCADNIPTFLYVGDGRGDYKLTPLAADAGSAIEVINAPVYIRCRSANDWLKEYVFHSLSGGDNERDSFMLEVETVRADEVTVEMAAEADLVYLENGLNGNPFFSLTGGTEGSGSLLSGMDYIGKVDGGIGDMDEDAAGEILRRAAEGMMPVIVDYDATVQDDYKDTNYQYLARTFMKEDLSAFYGMMNQNGNLMDNLKMNIDKTEEFPDREDNGCHYVNKNIYMVKGSVPLIYEDFHEEFDKDETAAGFGEVTAAIKAENMTLPEEDKISVSVSKARAIQYIINYSVGTAGEFDDLCILEIQPSANLSSDLHRTVDDGGNTKLYWKTDRMQAGKQILYSRKTFNVDTHVKSAAQFNGEREDINSVYDMVFIGLDGQRLNLGGDMFRSPVYNNEELKGKAYHTGDESGVGIYDGNDITAQKMADLLEYMEAGYPVLVEDNCFRKGTAQRAEADDINDRYIDKGTVMYRFLSRAVSDDRLRERIYTVSDAVSNPVFVAQMKADRPRLRLPAPDGKETPKVQCLKPDGDGAYQGRIAYEVRNKRGGEYPGDVSVHLYADTNYDGMFDSEEELWGYTDNGNEIVVAFDGMGPGILPWKLEIRDAGNRFRRDSVQGYFELDNAAYGKEVKVLQVAGASEDPEISLQEIYAHKENSVLAYYLQGIEGICNMSLQFETVTPGELAKRLEENSGYLGEWDVVVLTMDNILTVDSVTAAVANYAEEGRSLLVCSQNSDGDRMGLGAGLLGQEEENRTYVSLGAGGASGYYRYGGLRPDMFAPQASLQCEQANEGSIAYYPYRMECEAFGFGARSALRAADYLLDCDVLEDGGAPYVTAWYTLGGSNADSAYGVSPRDARNNYYCYSKGNVVWLGQSRYPYTYDGKNHKTPEGVEGSAECKLFANVLTAAYAAGIHGPDVDVVSGFAPDSARLQSISVPFDQEWTDAADSVSGMLDSTVDVYFRFADGNIAMDKSTQIHFYYEDPEGEEIDLGGGTARAVPFESGLWTVQDNQLVQADESGLQAGKTYRIQAPVTALRANAGKDKGDIYVVVTSDFKRGGRTYRATGCGAVSLNRAQLFLLE